MWDNLGSPIWQPVVNRQPASKTYMALPRVHYKHKELRRFRWLNAPDLQHGIFAHSRAFKVQMCVPSVNERANMLPTTSLQHTGAGILQQGR